MSKQIALPKNLVGRSVKLPAKLSQDVDLWLLVPAFTLLALGVVMVFSASLSIAESRHGYASYYLVRQLIYAGLGLALAALVLRIKLEYWYKASSLLLLLGFGLLILVLVPGIGKEVNGSSRWLSLGIFNLQASEPVKLFVVLYLAGYAVRREQELQSTVRGFLLPMAVLVLVSALLLLEPDFGATAVILATGLAMLFLGGTRLWQFGLLLCFIILALVALAVTSPYRLERLTTFLNPWADPFASGFQLTQALIAFGRGEWWGVGLGSSIQKLFYLPEAHTDFLFAVIGEELGLVGSLAVLALFTVLIVRALWVGYRAERGGHRFGAFLAYGLGLWIAMQALINIGVNMGVLPTKGLTLPLMSYGGSSIIVTCVAIALLLRVAFETAQPSLALADRRKRER